MARERRAEVQDRDGVVVPDETISCSADLGGVQQDRGDGQQSGFAEGEIVERRETVGVDDNGRGDGSEAYVKLASNLKGIKLPWGTADDPSRKRFPRLMALLTDKQTPKGRSREVARVGLAATPTGFRATLTDYLMSMKLTVDFERLLDMPKALEEGINGKRGFWTEVKAGEGYQIRKAEEKKALERSSGPM